MRSGDDGVKLAAVLWPGDTVSGPPARGRRTLRVVTAVADPFVMEQSWGVVLKKEVGGRLKQDLDKDLQLHRILILLY